jgi:tetratricopeptide (TPR) repeat protein
MRESITNRPGRAWIALTLFCALCASVFAQTVPSDSLPPSALPQSDRGLKRTDIQQTRPPNSNAKHLALCIGIDGYNSREYGPLHCCQADALALGRKLKALDYQVIVMTDAGKDINDNDKPNPDLIPTWRNLDDELFKFTKLADNPDDTVIVSFSGHGNVDPALGQSVLIPLDYVDENSRTMTIGELQDHLNRSPADKKLLILDSCRSSAGHPQDRMADGFLASFKSLKTMLVFTGCGENQSSVEDLSTGHGRLTEMLLKGLDGPAYDADHHPEFLFAVQWCSWVLEQFEANGWAAQQSPQLIGQISADVQFDICHRKLPPPPPLTDADHQMLAMCLQQAEESWKSRKFASAVDFATTALRIQDQNADALAMQALAYESGGYSKEAEQCAEDALAADPHQLLALFVKAHRSGDLPVLRRIAQDAADNPQRWALLASGELACECYTQIGFLLNESRHFDEAIDPLTRAVNMADAPPETVGIALSDRAFSYGHIGRYVSAVEDDQVILHMGSAAPQGLIVWTLADLGYQYDRLGYFDKEILCDSQLIGTPGAPPGDIAKALVNRGAAYGVQGRLQDEIDDDTRALASRGATIDVAAMARINRGFAYDRLGEPQKAIDDLNAVIAMRLLTSSDAIAHALVNRGVAYSRFGRFNDEIKDDTEVIQMINPPADQLREAFIDRGAAYAGIGKDRLSIADENVVILNADATPDELARALADRANAYNHLGETQNVIDDNTAVIRLKKVPPVDVATALINRGVAFSLFRRYDDEIADDNAVLEMKGILPEQVNQALIDRGAAYASSGKNELAIDDETRALQIEGLPPAEAAFALANRGFAYGHLGQYEKELQDESTILRMQIPTFAALNWVMLNRRTAFTRLHEFQREVDEDSSLLQTAGIAPAKAAQLLFDRAYGHHGLERFDAEIDDLNQIIGLKGAPAMVVAQARNALKQAADCIADEKTIAQDTAEIESKDIAPDELIIALVDRGTASMRVGRNDQAIADETRVLGMKNLPIDEKLQALVARGYANGNLGQFNEEIEDETQVIETGSTPPDLLAHALFARGLGCQAIGQFARALEDFKYILEMKDAPADAIAGATQARDRLVPFDNSKKIENCTSVIEAKDTPPDKLAYALVARGSVYAILSRDQEAVADFTRVIQMPNAPADAVAQALMNRAFEYDYLGRIEEEIADWTTAMQLKSPPPKLLVAALLNRGQAFGRHGDYDKDIADETLVLHSSTANAADLAEARGALAAAETNLQPPATIPTPQ